MKVAVIGANGQLGVDCCREFAAAGHEVLPLTRQEIDLVRGEDLTRTLEEARPDVIVNTAAMHNVEACEAAPEQAFLVNGIGSWYLAKAAHALDSVLIHISTDYVFDGARGVPYTEEDRPQPLNAYGNTKLSGEHFVLSTAPRSFVVRTSGLYGSSPCRAKNGGLNFAQLMLKLARERGSVKVVTDERVTPTYTRDLARQLVALSGSSGYGLVHATSQGDCSWYEFAEAIFDLAGIPVQTNVASSGDFPVKVPRPSYSVLANQRLQDLGIDLMPSWRESLRSFLEEVGELDARATVPGPKP